MNNLFLSAKSYINDTILETRRVAWPSKDLTFKYTLIVIGVSLAMAFLLGGVDFVLNLLIKQIVL